jgi:flagellar protein FlbB
MRATNKMKAVYLVLVVLFLTGLGFYWLDYIGLVSLDRMERKFFHRESPSVMYASDDEPSLIAKEEFDKAKEQLTERTEEIDRREALLTEQEKSFKADKDKLDELKRSLEQDRKRFEEEKNRYSGYQKNVADLATKLENMQPKDSVAIMIKWEDALLIDVLRQMDQNATNAGKKSITSYLISLMPKDKASHITYLMTQI